MAGLNIIIPAHNEAQVIESCLRSVLAQCRRARIIVVPNGCRDDTAARARSLIPHAEAAGSQLIVSELPRGNKPAALNHGDSLTRPGHRIYLDADVLLGAGAIENICRTLDSGYAFCAPAIRVAPGSSHFTRSYARIWQQLPSVRRDVIGAGLYAVSEAGRHRWTRFPDIISDDKFARLCFDNRERTVTPAGHFTIFMPEGLSELLLVRGRWCRGNAELARRFPILARRDRRHYAEASWSVVTRPSLWSAAPLFLFVFLVSMVISFLKQGTGTKTWERAAGARCRASHHLGN